MVLKTWNYSVIAPCILIDLWYSNSSQANDWLKLQPCQYMHNRPPSLFSLLNRLNLILHIYNLPTNDENSWDFKKLIVQLDKHIYIAFFVFFTKSVYNTHKLWSIVIRWLIIFTTGTLRKWLYLTQSHMVCSVHPVQQQQKKSCMQQTSALYYLIIWLVFCA